MHNCQTRHKIVLFRHLRASLRYTINYDIISDTISIKVTLFNKITANCSKINLLLPCGVRLLATAAKTQLSAGRLVMSAHRLLPSNDALNIYEASKQKNERTVDSRQ